MENFDIPTISLEDINDLQSSTEQQNVVVDSLRHACTEIGFFYLKIDSKDLSHNLIQNVFDQSKQFFNLPTDIKQKFTDCELNRGYTSMGEETLDPSKQSVGDTKEGYYIARDVPKNNPDYDPLKLSGPNVWPTKNGNDDDRMNLDCIQWKNVMNEYFDIMNKIGFRLVQLIALAIGLPHNFFDDKFSPPMAFLRLLHYSKQKSDVANGIFACGAHSDYGMVTLLATDDEPGLQILLQKNNLRASADDDNHYEVDKEEKWVNVAPPPIGTFVVNLGDMLERWTNGKFKSTVHRVVSSGAKERYSIPFFYEPNFDTVVECLDVCLEDGEEPKFPKTTAGGHLVEKYNQTHSDFHSSQ